MQHLDLVPIHLLGRQGLLDRLSLTLERTLGSSVRQREPWFDPEASFDESRGQYSSTTLLRLLLDEPSNPSVFVLGVAGVDLFVPILTYVFGEAQLGGRAAVVSIHRLRSDVYGLPRDDALLFRRLAKESVHEIGHCLGLIHCPDQACVMHPSTYVEEIDFKPETFCESCLELANQRGDSDLRLRANANGDHTAD